MSNLVPNRHKVERGIFMAKRKNQSLFEQVVALEQNLPAERQRLTDMEEAHKRAHKAYR